MKKSIPVLLLSLLTTMLVTVSCAPILIGGAVIGGVGVASDPRTSGSMVEDKAIYVKANNLILEKFKKKVDVSVTSYDRFVLLTGFVPSEQHKQDVAATVAGIQGVVEVYNELEVGNSISMWRKAQDSSLTGRIRAELLATKHLPSSSFKISTNNSTAYIMGMVLPEQKSKALDIISSVRGVSQVVSYIKELESKELEPETATESNLMQ